VAEEEAVPSVAAWEEEGVAAVAAALPSALPFLVAPRSPPV
jgi:hypothetical protein